MALRASAPDADLEQAAFGDAEASAGVEHGAELRTFARAVLADEGVAAARDALVTLVGPEGAFDAAGVVAFFNAVDRVADATGTWLDDGMKMGAELLLKDLDIGARLQHG
jgi:hypothetical protein